MISYSMTGRKAALRILQTEQDMQLVYDLHTNTQINGLWLVDRNLQGFDDFAEQWRRTLRRSVDACFVIHDIQTDQAVGLCYLYNHNVTDGTAYFCTVVLPDNIGSGIGLEAGKLLAAYAFGRLALRKLYAEVFAYNALVRRLLLMNGFREEACLLHHRWYNGRYWNLHILAWYRTGYEKREQSYNLHRL